MNISARFNRYSSLLIWVFFSVNFLFWIWLSIDVMRNIKPFAERPPTFEEMVPVYKFGKHAIPSKADHEMISLETMRMIQQPVYAIVVKAANSISGGSWDHRWGTLSIGSWVLITTMILSFLQWGIIAWVLGILIQSLKKRNLERQVSLIKENQ